MTNVAMKPMYDTVLFTDVFDDAGTFLYYCKRIGIPQNISDASVNLTYYLLYSKYGNNPIANFDVEQFKYKIFSTIWQYGPSWEKRLAIQQELRDLDLAALREGNKAVYNHAYNPADAPAADSDAALNYINEQNQTIYKKSKMDAYAQLWELIETDVTSEYLNKFKGCFKQFVAPERTWLYITEDEDDD